MKMKLSRTRDVTHYEMGPPTVGAAVGAAGAGAAVGGVGAI